MTLREPPGPSLYAILQRGSGKNKYSHVLQRVQPECFLTLGGPALWPTQNLFVHLLSVSLHSILRGGCHFSSSNLCPSLLATHLAQSLLLRYPRTERPGSPAGHPWLRSLFHRNASQRPSCTSLWSLWSSCKHRQNQWDFHSAGWGTRCRCYW